MAMWISIAFIVGYLIGESGLLRLAGERLAAGQSTGTTTHAACCRTGRNRLARRFEATELTDRTFTGRRTGG